MATTERITEPLKSARTRNIAPYACISMENDRTPKSLLSQISCYSELIQATPGWGYAGAYADSGIPSGKLHIPSSPSYMWGIMSRVNASLT